MRYLLKRPVILLLSVLLCFSSLYAPAGRALCEAAQETASAEETAAPAKAYILLTYSGGSFWLPLPESEDYTLPVRQLREDGTETVNLIHVTPNGFYMESSTCEGQDCVHQGEVTLENRDERILYNAVLCLPNMVSLALYTPDEILEMYASPSSGTADAQEAESENRQ